MGARITSSATYISTLPKARRSQLLECIDKRLDAALLSDMDSDDINRLLWLMTRVKPCSRISELRVVNYKDLAALLKKAAARVQNARVQAGAEEDIVALCRLEQDAREGVRRAAEAAGWQDAFGSARKPKPSPADRRSRGGRSPATTNRRSRGRQSSQTPVPRRHPRFQPPSESGLDADLDLDDASQRSIDEFLRPRPRGQGGNAGRGQPSGAVTPEQPLPLPQPPAATRPPAGTRPPAAPVSAQARSAEPSTGAFRLVLDVMSQCYKMHNSDDGTWSWCSQPGDRCELTEVAGQPYLRFVDTGLPASFFTSFVNSLCAARSQRSWRLSPCAHSMRHGSLKQA